MSAAAHEQLERLSALLPRVASVRTAADLDVVLPAVAEAAFEASGAACVAVFLRSRDAAGMEPVAFHGPAHLRRQLAVARPPVGGDGATWVALTDKDGTPLGYLGASGLPDGASGVLAAVAAYGAQALRGPAPRSPRPATATPWRRSCGCAPSSTCARASTCSWRNVVDAIRETLGYGTVDIQLGKDEGDWPQAATVIPLHERDRRLGVLVAADAPDTSDPEALAILRLFAASAANRILATETHEAAERLAGTDALTGLGNRGMFVGCVERALRAAAGEVAILLCDMDGLKALNDAEGHAAGDARLRLTADVLAGACADGESAHRLGGDEFAVLVPAGGAERAARLAGEIDAALSAAGAGASIGWAAGGAQATIDELLDRADAGMYRVKRGRRARQV